MEDEDPSSGSERDGRAYNPGLPTPSIAAPVNQHCIKILVATDNHIGYAESDPIRGQDSINTFREILQLAIEHDVDMLLLAGDLFHENRPSRTSLYSTIASLREYCLNSRPIRIELVGDAGIGIPHSFNFPPVNYEDENINVGLPVFSIHGNHDDPQGVGPEGALCALDVLSASGLVNYFGRQELPGAAQNDQEALEQGLHIQPILLQKGRTKLAIYGIGNIRDERFHYEMRSNRIRMSRPAEFRDQWFNLMLVHQNRVAHGPKNSVPENGFGDDVDLLIWGHEHDCLIAPVEVPGKGYYISQPGSSVATSLAKGEALKKHVAILNIQDHDFCMTPIPLKTVRPFVFHDIVLSEVEEDGKEKFNDKPEVIKYLQDEVEKLIDQANAQWDDMHSDEPDPIPSMLPLIRLRVEYSRLDGNGAYEVGNPQRFGQDFIGKVANPKDVVQFYRKKKIGTRKPKNDIDQPEDEVPVDSQGATLKSEKNEVAAYVHQYLEAQSLGVLAENGMQNAVDMFVEKDNKDAIKAFYQGALQASQAYVKKSEPAGSQNRDKDRDEDSDDEELLEQLTRAKEAYAEEWEKKDRRAVEKNRAKAATKASRSRKRNDDDSDESDFGRMSDVRHLSPSDEESDASLMPPPKGKGKGAASSKTPARNQREPSDSEASSQASVAPPKKAPAKKSAPAKKAPVKKAPVKKTAAASKSKAGASRTQTTLNFSQAPPQRGAGARTGRGGAVEEDSDTLDESEESVQTKRKPKPTTSARARR